MAFPEVYFSVRDSVRREAGAYAVLFLYVFWFRAHGLDEGFVLMGDQVRDWDVARRSFSDLPPGVPSMAGGTTLGPNFYWILWVIARVVGPLFDYLPHAGGVGISLLQSQADVFLAWALRRRTGSLAVSLAIVLLSATSVPDAIISSSIWNPAVATALLKVGLALVLTRAAASVVTTVSIAAAAWGALQTHTTAALVAIPLIVAVMLEPVTRSWRLAFRNSAIVAGVILIMQIPWLIHMVSVGGQGPTAVADSVFSVLRSPGEALRLGTSTEAFSRNLASILFFPLSASWLPLLLPAGILATLVVSRDRRLTVVGPVPCLFAVLALSLWQGAYERYWVLVVGPSAAICLFA
jgi:hypothetical protein